MLGLVVLAIAIVFAAVLVIVMLAGAGRGLMSGFAVVLQLVVLAAALAALRSPRARRHAAIALAVSLFVNVWTVGTVGMLRAAETRDYAGVSTYAQEHAATFPGRKGYDSAEHADDVYHFASYEEAVVRTEELMRLVREEITAQTGIVWVEYAPAETRTVPNGYGGDSMYLEYRPSVWVADRAVTDVAEKTAIAEAYVRIVEAHDPSAYISQRNDPDEWGDYADEDFQHRRWGGDDIATQHTWQTAVWLDEFGMALEIVDLSAPTADDDLLSYRAYVEQYVGEPREGVILSINPVDAVPEAQRAEFVERMQEYPDL